MKTKHRFAGGLTTALEYLSMVLIAAIAVLVIAQVVMRYVFNDPLEWSEEMARLTFISLAFAGIGAAYGRRRHMFIDALIILLPSRAKRIVEIAVVVTATAFLLAVIVISAGSIADLHKMEVTTPALEWPMAYVYLVIPLGFLALIAQMWLALYRNGRSV
jgi:TRAP-type C4-dicarboxylate transport system permease small subunit